MNLSKPFILITQRHFKQLSIYLWHLWDRFFHLCFGLKKIGNIDPAFFLYRVRRYLGNDVVLSDKEILRHGDRVIELHLNNKMLAGFASESQSLVHCAVKIIQMVKQTLPYINEIVTSETSYYDVKAIYGITLIHQGAERLGFTVMDLPSGFFSKITQSYLRFLLTVIHPDGMVRLKGNNDTLKPKLVVLSAKTLKQKYGQHRK